jgi:hypothetical protein
MPGKRNKIFAVCLLMAIQFPHISGNGQASQHSPPTEYEVRAAFLYNFIKFVEWPEDVFQDSLSPIVIGIIGQDPFGELMEALIKKRTIQSRTIIVKRFDRIEDYQYCHVLYLGFRERRYQVTILKHLQKTPVLTIGDSEEFTRLGGMIKFIVTGKQVGFEINLNAVERSRLEISAKLLKLAKITHY